MIFNSLSFLVFFPTVVLLYYLIPHRFRWVLLLLASYVFYGYWKIEYLALIVISTLVDFSVGRYLNRETNSGKRKAALALSLLVNLGMLFTFKYANWFINDLLPSAALNGLASVFPSISSGLNLVLPVGISFYTFQTMSYTIDVYYNKVKAESNLAKFALFVSFFPQLVAGPIERFQRLHHQLFEFHHFSYENLKYGLRLMLWGLFIKMCVADNLSPLVDQIFERYTEASSIQLLIGMLGFSIQIYSDFQGYSLIAIGTARVLGIRLIYNFNAPYFAQSIRDFWSRWHISLSTWFRDYLYIPLGGSKVSTLKVSLNVLVVFIVSGLWHGANLTFLAWGAIHGLGYLAQKYFRFHSPSTLIKIANRLVTLTLVCFAWVFFRSVSVTDGFDFIQNIVTSNTNHITLGWNPLIISFAGLFLLSDFVFKHGDIHNWLEHQTLVKRWVVYTFLIYSIFGFSGTVNHPFIYFQF